MGIVMLPPAELEDLFSAPESDRVERKRSSSDRSALRRTICAFANDLPGHNKPGIIFIGVEDDGRCANLKLDDPLLSALAQMRSDGNILPWPEMSVQQHHIGNCDLGVICVAPSLYPPVRYQGRVWVKIGPTVQLAGPGEEQRLAERRRAGDLPLDLRGAPAAALDDLDIDYFRRNYLPCAVAPEVLVQNQRSVAQQLESLRLLTRGIPSYGALLAFGKDPLSWVPGAYVQFARFDGTELTDPIKDQRQLTGPLYQILARLDELLEINIAIATDVVSADKELRHPDYPLVALQQLVRNALMHRTYEGTHTPVKIYWFKDRVEIHNPGGLYGQVTPANFGRGPTDYRNPLLAEVMHTLGYVQKFGMGIPLSYQELRKNGNPEPEFRFETNHFLALVRPAA